MVSRSYSLSLYSFFPLFIIILIFYYWLAFYLIHCLIRPLNMMISFFVVYQSILDVKCDVLWALDHIENML